MYEHTGVIEDIVITGGTGAYRGHGRHLSYWSTMGLLEAQEHTGVTEDTGVSGGRGALNGYWRHRSHWGCRST